MSSSKSLLRGVLFLVLFGGITLMAWPLGQTAFGWWNQRALHADWQSAAQHSAKLPPKAAKSAKSSHAHSAKSRTAKAQAPKTGAVKTTPVKAVSSPVQPWTPTRIVIPEINVDAVVLQGMDEGSLRRGPGHDPRSVLPGQPGNCVIAGHRNVFGAWFADLDRLWAGSTIELRTPQQTFTYRVLTSSQVSQHDTSVLQNPPGDNTPRLTLLTCTLPASLYRHIVTAELDSESTSGSAS